MKSKIPTGIETSPIAPAQDENAQFSFALARTRLHQAILRDQTDQHAELVQENEWLLHTCESELKLSGNAFALEDTISGQGTVFVKLAPLPSERATQSDWDISVRNNGSLELFESDGYQWRIRKYEGGKWGRIMAMHAISREIRPYNPSQDGLLLTNTWGDRNKDGRISATFIKAEIEAAARLGADIFQIDDGWQEGVTSNSVKAEDDQSQGVWGSYYAQRPDFWDVNRTRLPQGLSELFEKAREKGLRVGLWFSPDSSDEGALWERDVQTILRFYQEWGVEFVKVDGLKIQSQTSETRLTSLFKSALRQSSGGLCFDFDITAEDRFGYFGLIETGALFIENRYTDWRRYWPHHTLRVAWQLAHWVDPVRLRLEWLNHTRNLEKYEGDPLGPANYRPDALFASVMFCAPLGWFEVQNLPESYFEEAAPLIAKWKTHREEIHSGAILPIGEAPDGSAWTGFVSLAQNRKSGHILLFRELNEDSEFQMRVPLVEKQNGEVEVLGGEGTASLRNGFLSVQIPEKLRFIWVRFAL